MELGIRYNVNAKKIAKYIDEYGISEELGNLLIEHLGMVNEIIGESDVLSCGK